MFRRILIITGVLLSLAGTAEAGEKAESDDGIHRVMTCNIRITGLEADAPYPERVWENRRDLCVETILSRRPDIICLQEAIYDSYAYLKEMLRGYVPYGFAGPEMDPYTEGYHFIGKNVIFFRRDRYEFVSAGCYWLSETPLIGGSCSWNTTRARHCNWVRLRDKRSGRELRVLDVHLDHKSDEARREQIRMVMDECAQYAPDFPQILCGDFNAGIDSAPIGSARSTAGARCTRASTGRARRASPPMPSRARSTSPRSRTASISSSIAATWRCAMRRSCATARGRCTPATTISSSRSSRFAERREGIEKRAGLRRPARFRFGELSSIEFGQIESDEPVVGVYDAVKSFLIG